MPPTGVITCGANGGTSMKRPTRLTVFLTMLAILGSGPAAFAADPTQSDFDACNREAQTAGTPAASPGTTTGGTSSGTMSGTTSGTTSGTSTSGGLSTGGSSPSASGSVQTPAGSAS